LINLDPTVGAEIQKTRLAVIVNDDGVGVLPLRVIVPLTDWKAVITRTLRSAESKRSLERRLSERKSKRQ
jgi:mRNA interferase MazF